jgi:hypothetical protein
MPPVLRSEPTTPTVKTVRGTADAKNPTNSTSTGTTMLENTMMVTRKFYILVIHKIICLDSIILLHII